MKRIILGVAVAALTIGIAAPAHAYTGETPRSMADFCEYRRTEVPYPAPARWDGPLLAGMTSDGKFLNGWNAGSSPRDWGYPVTEVIVQCSDQTWWPYGDGNYTKPGPAPEPAPEPAPLPEPVATTAQVVGGVGNTALQNSGNTTTTNINSGNTTNNITTINNTTTINKTIVITIGGQTYKVTPEGRLVKVKKRRS
jgi:hypothetical protein